MLNIENMTCTAGRKTKGIEENLSLQVDHLQLVVEVGLPALGDLHKHPFPLVEGHILARG